MRRKDQGSRWGEVPKSGAGHPPALPVDLPPLSTGPDQTPQRVRLAILLFVKVAHQKRQPVEQQRHLTTGELYALCKQKILRTISKSYQLFLKAVHAGWNIYRSCYAD